MADSNEGSEAGDQYVSISNALKLISQPFDGNKSKLKEFIDNADTAFELVNPTQHNVLLKFVKSKIVSDAKAKLLVRERTNSWEEVKEILEENYSVRRTIDFYACKLFNARQGNSESVASWGSRVDTHVTDLKEAAMRVCTHPQEQGAIALIQHLARACFTQGLNNERIQTVLRSKSSQIETLGMAVEAALEEESNLLSQRERGRTMLDKVSQGSERRPTCSNCGRNGHRVDNCFFKKSVTRGPAPGKNVHVGMSQEPEKVSLRYPRNSEMNRTSRVYHTKYTRNQNEVTCFTCGKKGHFASNCYHGTPNYKYRESRSNNEQQRNYQKPNWFQNERGSQGKIVSHGNSEANHRNREVSNRGENKGN